jgi:hypothetical protein
MYIVVFVSQYQFTITPPTCHHTLPYTAFANHPHLWNCHTKNFHPYLLWNCHRNNCLCFSRPYTVAPQHPQQIRPVEPPHVELCHTLPHSAFSSLANLGTQKSSRAFGEWRRNIHNKPDLWKHHTENCHIPHIPCHTVLPEKSGSIRHKSRSPTRTATSTTNQTCGTHTL